jgi:hypothetical protein
MTMRKTHGPKARVKDRQSVFLYAVMSSYKPAVPFHVKASRRQAKAVKCSALWPEEHLPIQRIKGRFEGNRYRIGFIRWGAYEELIKHLADAKAGRYRLETFAEVLRHAVEKTGLKEDVILENLEQFTSGSFIHREPRHALDLPDVLIGDEERYVPGEEFDRRNAAFERARDINHKRTRHYAGTDWAVVLQIGDTLEQPSPLRTSFSGAKGVETVTTYRPMRVVKPTALELRQLGCGSRNGVAAVTGKTTSRHRASSKALNRKAR